MDSVGAADYGLALLRIAVGITMAAHGYSKFAFGGRLAGTAGWFDSIGMRPGWFHARLAATAECGAGLLMVAGFLTPLAGAGFVALMLVAAWTVHRDNGFFIVNAGWEYNLNLAVIGVVVAVTGPGKISVDYLIGEPMAVGGGAGFAIAAFGGGLLGVGQLAWFYRPAEAERRDVHEST